MGCVDYPNQAHGNCVPEWMHPLKVIALQKTRGSSARLRGLGVVISVVIAGLAIFALTHALNNVDYDEVLGAVRRTNAGTIVLALMLVATSYGSLTLYDLLALRTIGRADIPYRIAALASFSSYPIAHGVGAVTLIAPVIRYRIYSHHGLGVFDVANISFLTGLTFWLGNLTALGLSLLVAPDAISLIGFLPAPVNRWLAVALLLGVFAFLLWTWRRPRWKTSRWCPGFELEWEPTSMRPKNSGTSGSSCRATRRAARLASRISRASLSPPWAFNPATLRRIASRLRRAWARYSCSVLSSSPSAGPTGVPPTVPGCQVSSCP